MRHVAAVLTVLVPVLIGVLAYLIGRRNQGNGGNPAAATPREKPSQTAQSHTPKAHTQQSQTGKHQAAKSQTGRHQAGPGKTETPQAGPVKTETPQAPERPADDR